MQKLVLANRTEAPHFISIHMKVRMGDLAGYHIIMGEWRALNPNKRLVVYYNPHDRIHEYSRNIPLDWVFENIADEVWLKDPQDQMGQPPGTKVYEFYGSSPVYIHIWAKWGQLRRSRVFQPTLKVRPDMIAKADATLAQHKIPKEFVVVQALFDAGYHRYRNAPLQWWIDVAGESAKKVPTILIGPTRWMGTPKMPPGVFPMFQHVPNPYDALAIMSRAKVMVGGETGLPLWASVLKVPVVAAFRRWCLEEGKFDYRPISFGAPVVFSGLEKRPAEVAQTIVGVFDGSIKDSTPT